MKPILTPDTLLPNFNTHNSLTYNSLLKLIDLGIISNSSKDNVKTASIDIRLSNIVMIENNTILVANKIIDPLCLSDKESNFSYMELDISNNGILLHPRRFILASTVENFNMPANLKGRFSLTSSLGRCGLDHCLSISLWPGWSGKLILELSNNREFYSIKLTDGMIIGQVEFEICEEVPEEMLYHKYGKYNGLLKTESAR